MTEIFNLLIVYLTNTLLFVRIKQTNKNRSPKAAIQMCSLKYVFLGKKQKSRENTWKTTGERIHFSVKFWALSLQIYKGWKFSHIFYKDFAKVIIYPTFVIFLKI